MTRKPATPSGEILRLKARVRERDGMRCVRCGLTNEEHKQSTGKSLHVHRLTPGAKYTVDGCIAVCFSCHGKEARRGKGEVDIENPNPLPQVNLPTYLYNQLRDLARRNHRPLKWELELAVEAYLRAHEGQGGED